MILFATIINVTFTLEQT